MTPETISIGDLRPAPYNPRVIDELAYSALRHSIRRLGVVIPLIVDAKDGTIIAGHQRSRAARDEGVSRVPCFFVSGVSPADEVRFNQAHNGTGFDVGLIAKIDATGLMTGWQEVSAAVNNVRCRAAAIVTETCKLLNRYGNVLSGVMAPDGSVLEGVAYFAACRLLGIAPNAYVVPSEDAGFARDAFSRSYGAFSYEHLEKRTYVQGLAQRPRFPERRGRGRSYASRLYERMVIPSLQEGQRALDFGAGRGDYAKRLSIESWEPYRHNGRGIDISAGRRDYERLIRSLRRRGLYDVLVCDSVLNSTDSMEAEAAVVSSLNALCKPGGLVFVSGRPIEAVRNKMAFKSLAAKKSWLEYLDKDGFTANLRRGQWYYQHYHTHEAFLFLTEAHGFSVERYENDSNAWRATWRKIEDDPGAEMGLRFEGSLPIPGGRYDYGQALVEAWEAAK